MRVSYTAPFVADYIRDNIKDVEEVVRFSSLSLDLHYKDRSFKELFAYACDNHVFNVFDFKLLKGDSKSVLESPNSILLSESITIKYFGDENPIGKTLTTYNKSGEEISLEVTGILKDTPQNSHIQFDILVSMNTVKYFVRETGMKMIGMVAIPICCYMKIQNPMKYKEV